MPFLYEWIVALASWMIPRGRRAQWRRERTTSIGRLWIDGGSPRGISGELLRASLACFGDALRSQRREPGEGAFQSLGGTLGAAARHPFATLLLAGMLVAAPFALGAVWRVLGDLVLRPMPFRDPGRVVLAYPSTPLMGGPAGVLPIKFLAWRRLCPTFQSLSAYRFSEVEAPDVSGRPVKIQVLSVSHDLLSTLGVTPALGRGFQEADDRPGAAPVALLTHDAWRGRFAADPNVVGRSIDLGGKLHSIVGVLPRGFWFLSRRTVLWTPLAEDLDPTRGLPPVLHVGPYLVRPGRIIPDSLLNKNPVEVVGRLKPGARIDVARYELRTAARRTYPSSGRDWVRVAPVGELLARSLVAPFAVIGFTAGLATLIALIGVARLLWRRRKGEPQTTDWRYWLFFAGKSYFGLAAIGCAWILIVDPSGRIDLSRGLGEYAGLVTTWVFALVACGFLHLSWRDQQMRCHVCLRRMRIPASSGSWASYIFNRPKTEYLCPAGHGTVSVSPGEPGGPESSDWKDMDESWRDLFKNP